MQIKMKNQPCVILLVFALVNSERHIQFQLDEDINMISDRIYAVPRPSAPKIRHADSKRQDEYPNKPYKKDINYKYPLSTMDKRASTYCGAFMNCETCTKSEFFGCGWCHKYGCTYSPETFCPRAKKAVFPRTHRPVNETCPMIYTTRPLVAHVGIVNVKVKIHVVDPAMLDDNLQCQILFPGYPQPLYLPARLVDDEVQCDTFDSYAVKHLRGTLSVMWEGVVQRSNELVLGLYDCEGIGSNFWQCKAVPPEYRCIWCGMRQRCVYTGRCSEMQTKNQLTYY